MPGTAERRAVAEGVPGMQSPFAFAESLWTQRPFAHPPQFIHCTAVARCPHRPPAYRRRPLLRAATMSMASQLRAVIYSDFVRQTAGSVLAQVFLSLVNFLFGLLLIRYASKTEYGAYAICFAVIQIFLSIQNAAANTPMITLIGPKAAPDKDRFLSGLFWGQWYFLIPAALLFAVIVSLYDSLQPGAAHLPVWMTCVAAGTSCAREFPRAYEFFRLSINRVLMIDLSYAGACLVGMVFLMSMSKVSTEAALAVIAFAGVLSAFAAHRIGGRKYPLAFIHIRHALRESWAITKWALVGVTVTNVQSYAYLFIVSYQLDLQDTADISAARLFFMPFGLIVASTQRLILSKGMHARDRGGRELGRLLTAFAGLFACVWVAYFGLVLSVQGAVIGKVFTLKYENIGGYVLLWAAVFLVNSMAFLLGQGLQVMGDFKNLSLKNAVSALSLVVCCVALTSGIGPVGSLMSLIAGDLTFIALLGPRLMRMLRTSSGR